jgi:hypothetical protein
MSSRQAFQAARRRRPRKNGKTPGTTSPPSTPLRTTPPGVFTHPLPLCIAKSELLELLELKRGKKKKMAKR